MAGRIVLIGAGHAHMEALRQAERFLEAGLSLTIIDPGAFWYSGAATALLAGALDVAQARAEPAALPGAFETIAARAVQIDAQARQVTLEDGRTVAFDVVSLNTGSSVAGLSDGGATPVKPVSNLYEVRKRIETADGAVSLAVVGTGATGVEAALNLAALQRRLGAPVNVTLVGPDPLLPGWPDRAARHAANALQAAGVRRLNRRAEAVREGVLVDETGARHHAELVLTATGLVAQLPGGLEAGNEGLPVGPDMAWLKDRNIFAAGDCAHMTHGPRPKLGVFGVRAAPVLIDNLIAAGAGHAERRRYDPQERWLSLMDLGDGTGLGRYGGLSARGRPLLWLKRFIDARFVRRYQVRP